MEMPLPDASVLARRDRILAQLAAVLPAERGRDLLKSVRTHLVEASRDRLQQMIESTSGMACISMHHDVSTSTGEEVFVFTLSEEPSLRTAKRK